jgi:Domain of unknown function (DUF1772)
MKPTNDALLAKAAEAESAGTVAVNDVPVSKSEAESDKTVKQLLDKWATLNLARGVITALASVLGIWAVVGDTKEMIFGFGA